ncbi:MAG TPA: hypothetical protein VF174_10055 [Micromonosporaceae bacterium]
MYAELPVYPFQIIDHVAFREYVFSDDADLDAITSAIMSALEEMRSVVRKDPAWLDPYGVWNAEWEVRREEDNSLAVYNEYEDEMGEELDELVYYAYLRA